MKDNARERRKRRMAKHNYGPFRFIAAVETIAEAALQQNQRTPPPRKPSTSTPATQPSSRESSKSSRSEDTSKEGGSFSGKGTPPKTSFQKKLDEMFNPESWAANCATHHDSSAKSVEYPMDETISVAATEVATNRAVDLAMKRIQEMDAEADKILMEKARNAKRNGPAPVRVGFGVSEVNPRVLETKSIMSTSSCEDAESFDVLGGLQGGNQQRPRPIYNDKLQRHMRKHEPPLGPIDWQTASLSSSVGVEIHAQQQRASKHSTTRAKYGLESASKSSISMDKLSQDSDRTQFDPAESFKSLASDDNSLLLPPVIERFGDVQPAKIMSENRPRQPDFATESRHNLSREMYSRDLLPATRAAPSKDSRTAIEHSPPPQESRGETKKSLKSELKRRRELREGKFSVTNIRAAFESVHDTSGEFPQDEKTKDDDDSISVQSIKDKFHVVNEIKHVSKVQQMRAIFERNQGTEKAEAKEKTPAASPPSGTIHRKTVLQVNEASSGESDNQTRDPVIKERAWPGRYSKPDETKPEPATPGPRIHRPVPVKPQAASFPNSDSTAKPLNKPGGIGGRIAMFSQLSKQGDFSKESIQKFQGAENITLSESDEDKDDEKEAEHEDQPGPLPNLTSRRLLESHVPIIQPTAKRPLQPRAPVLPETHWADSYDEASTDTDGVTLEVSVAEISQLTDPTALVSIKTSEYRDEENSYSSKKSSNVTTSDARPSEASSSQPSEAAIPLLARALRSKLLSDEVSSTDSFVAARAKEARQWSPDLDRKYYGEEKKEEVVDSEEQESVGWDVNRIEQTFPVTNSSAGDLFDFESKWEDLGRKEAKSPAVKIDSSFESRQGHSTQTPPSGNKSLAPFQPDLNLSNREYFIGTTRQRTKKASVDDAADGFFVVPHSDIDEALYKQFTTRSPATLARVSERSPPSTPPARRSPPTRRTPVIKKDPSDFVSAAPKPTDFARYRQEQAAMRDRLKQVREARIRRATAFGYSPSIAVTPEDFDDPTDEASMMSYSVSTMSSTRPGGATFDAALMELD